MTKIYVVQQDDYDSTTPCGVYASIQSALSNSIAVEQFGWSGDGLDIYCYTLDEAIAVWDSDGSDPDEQTGLKYLDRRVASVTLKHNDGTAIILKIDHAHCTQLNLNPAELVSNTAKDYGFKISKTTTAGEIVIFELTKGKEE